MNRAELIEAMSQSTGTSKAANEQWLTAFTDLIKQNIDGGVKLVGFGAFKVASRKERVARNPQTGENITIPARQVPVFRPGLELKQLVNKSKG